jgi:hypothetical protein
VNVILVGLDGLEPSLVERWADDLPTLRRLTNEGSFVRSDDVADRSILDVFPLVLDLVDAPVPEDVDGEVPADRLAYEPDPAIRGSHDDEARSRDYTEAESEDVREQLKGLGYLE